MEVILLERIARLGQMGDVVRVRDGYARNFLLPQGKALRSNDASRKRFEADRVQLEARNLERKSEAEQVATKLAGQSFIVVRQAAETGQLYGSVSARDLAEIMAAQGSNISRSQIAINPPIKTIGMHEVRLILHPEVDTRITVNVARSEDEAARQARGEDVTVARDSDEAEAEAQPAAAAEDAQPAPEGAETAEAAKSSTE